MIDADRPFATAPLGPTESVTLALAARRFFSFAGPRLIVAVVVATIAVRVAVGGPARVADAIACAAIFVVWAFQEWFAHKHLLHIKPIRVFGTEIDLYFAREHRRHHRTPWDIRGALLPLRVLVVAVPASAALFLLVVPDRGVALTCMAAYSTMALVYDWTHYLTHTPYPPRGRLYRRVCRAHRLHHFKNENLWFGFTLPFVDALFGTSPEPATVALSSTCKTLGVDDDPRRFTL